MTSQQSVEDWHSTSAVREEEEEGVGVVEEVERLLEMELVREAR
jgi:hypothetical protein